MEQKLPSERIKEIKKALDDFELELSYKKSYKINNLLFNCDHRLATLWINDNGIERLPTKEEIKIFNNYINNVMID